MQLKKGGTAILKISWTNWKCIRTSCPQIKTKTVECIMLCKLHGKKMWTYSVNTPPPSVVGTPHPSQPHHHPTGRQRDIPGRHVVPSSPSVEESAPQGTLQTGSVLLHWRARAATPLQQCTLSSSQPGILHLYDVYTYSVPYSNNWCYLNL